jgi:hypothetical protein
VIGREILFEDRRLRVSRQGHACGRNVILCFTGLGQRLGATGGPEEFVGSTQLADFDAVFVTDKTKSWFNAFPVERLLDILGPVVVDKTIYSLGSSMGGFGAIWITRYLPVKAVLAFGPQFSVHPEVVPDEKRWPVARAGITQWRVRSLEGHFMPHTEYVTLSGIEDELQWSRFPIGPGLTHLLVESAGHNAAEHLKAAGSLRSLVSEVFAGQGIAAWRADQAGVVDAPIGQPAAFATIRR